MGEHECFVRFDDVGFWKFRTRALRANAETYSYPAFRESFRELRRESRKAEFALVVALYQFDQEMEEEAEPVRFIASMPPSGHYSDPPPKSRRTIPVEAQ